MGEIRFKSFSSGSCGNCYFLGQEEEGGIKAGILIDTGVSIRRIKKELAAEGLSMDDFSAILVTHDHLDHIRALGSFCKHLPRPVFATKVLHDALSRNLFTKDYIGGVRRYMSEDGFTEIIPDIISARCFIVPHDATQTAGYCIKIEDYIFVIITDAGKVTPEAIEYASKASTVVIESNYDSFMLDHGPYTRELKDRIRGGCGHLSNDECATAIKEFARPHLKNVFLCHLSENNNTPSAAHKCSREALDSICRQDVRLVTLPRQLPSRLFTL